MTMCYLATEFREHQSSTVLLTNKMRKALRETQTLHADCSKAEYCTVKLTSSYV